MHAYVFLTRGATEPLSGFVWPTPADGEPGEWVPASTAPTDALRGYPAPDLPYWLDDELWRVELAGSLRQRSHLLLPERARLVEQISTWDDSTAWEFAAACASRVAQQTTRALRTAGRADAATRLEEASDLRQLELAASTVADSSPVGTSAGYLADVCFYAQDAAVGARAAVVAAKMSAYALAGEGADAPDRLSSERAWQAGWLVTRLGLDEAVVEDRIGEAEPGIQPNDR